MIRHDHPVRKYLLIPAVIALSLVGTPAKAAKRGSALNSALESLRSEHADSPVTEKHAAIVAAYGQLVESLKLDAQAILKSGDVFYRHHRGEAEQGAGLEQLQGLLPVLSELGVKEDEITPALRSYLDSRMGAVAEIRKSTAQARERQSNRRYPLQPLMSHADWIDWRNGNQYWAEEVPRPWNPHEPAWSVTVKNVDSKKPSDTFLLESPEWIGTEGKASLNVYGFQDRAVGSYRHNLIRLDLAKRETISPVLNFEEYQNSAMLSANGKKLVVATFAGPDSRSTDLYVIDWDTTVAKPKRVKRFKDKISGSTPAISPDGNWVAAQLENSGKIWLYDTKNKTEITYDRPKIKHGDSTWTALGLLAFSFDSKTLTHFRDTDGDVTIWKMGTQAPPEKLKLSATYKNAMFAGDGRFLVKAKSETNEILLVSLEDTAEATITLPDTIDKMEESNTLDTRATTLVFEDEGKSSRGRNEPGPPVGHIDWIPFLTQINWW